MHTRNTVYTTILLIVCLLFLPLRLYAQQWAGSGITEPFRSAVVSSTVSGTISAINVQEGAFVKKGDTVIELDSTLERLEVERRKLIAESKVDLEASKEQLEILKKDYESTRALFEETKSISEQEVYRRRLEYMAAQAEHDRRILGEQLEELEYEIAKAQLERRIIKAPFDAVVVEVIAEVGENCSPQQPLIRIADTRRVRLVVYVEPNISRQLRPSMSVRVTIEESDSPIVRRGEVEFISPIVDASSGLREVKVLFNNENGSVAPGATGSLLLE